MNKEAPPLKPKIQQDMFDERYEIDADELKEEEAPND